MTYTTLRDNLWDLLVSISGLHQVVAQPSFEFSGYPAAFIAPSGNESDFLTNIENVRVYAFKVWLFQEYDTTPLAVAYERLMDRTDEILNKIDLQESPDSTRSLATGISYPYFLSKVFATPGQFALDEEPKLLACEITIKCQVVVDLTSLT